MRSFAGTYPDLRRSYLPVLIVSGGFTTSCAPDVPEEVVGPATPRALSRARCEQEHRQAPVDLPIPLSELTARWSMGALLPACWAAAWAETARGAGAMS